MINKRNILVLIVVSIAILGWYVFDSAAPQRGASNSPRPEAGVLVGNYLAEFQLPDLADKSVKTGGAGKITVLNFWATWCPPCRAEMPELAAFTAKKGTDVDFYAINIQEPAATVTEYLKQNQLTMPILLDKKGEIARTFRINAIPTTIIADKQGVIRYRKSGPVTLSELEGVIKGL